jgi:2-dehydropantoate 2-reductase
MDTKMHSLASPARRAFTNWLRYVNKSATNRVTMRFAGKHVYAIIHHQGRKSGKSYQTPVVAMPFDDSFVIPLPYGQHVDWCRNVMAAGACRMEWRGRMYTLRAPRLIGPLAALPAFPEWVQRLLDRTEIYLQLERAAIPELPPEREIRKVLVYGAGVLGSLYAGKLHQAGYDVTLLARGQRLAELREHGLILVEDGTGRLEHFPVRVISELAPEDAYDLALVIVRKNQVPGVLPDFAANQHTPNVLFMCNNAAGPEQMVQALGRERVLLGFPGGGGQREEGVVRYMLAGKAQPTTIGEVDGARTGRLAQIAAVIQDAGLPVKISANMDAWLKTHVALVSPIGNAIYLAGGSNYRLARTPDGLVLMFRAIKEGLRVLDALHIPITPSRYRVLWWLPEPLVVAVLRRRLATPAAELALARHANAARDEMLRVAVEFRALAAQSGIPTPAIDILFCFTDPENAPIPEGQSVIRMSWGPTIAAAGALVSAVVLGGWMVLKGTRNRGRRG